MVVLFFVFFGPIRFVGFFGGFFGFVDRFTGADGPFVADFSNGHCVSPFFDYMVNMVSEFVKSVNN